MRRALLAAAVACAAACGLPDGETFGPVPEPRPGRFTWCNAGEPDSLDPAQATSSVDVKVVYALFDGLVSHDPDGLPVPSLARSWEVSADQRVFTFHLRDDARWSNGRPLTADDLVYSYARVLHPTTGAAGAEILWRLRHAREYTQGRARLVLRPSGPFAVGEAVAVEGDAAPRDGRRLARAAVELRLEPRPDAAVVGRAAAGAEVELVDVGGPGCASRPRRPVDCDWAYVFHPGVPEGFLGWARVADLEAPEAGRRLAVRALDDPPASARRAEIPAADLAQLPDLLGVAAPDAYTLVLTTGGPTPSLVALLLQRPFRPVPREAVSRWPRTWIRPGRIVTSGPFDLVAWRARDRLELRRSATFWGRAGVRLETVVVLSVGDQAAAAHLYYTGACDAVVSNNIPASYLPALAGENGGQRRRDYLRVPALAENLYLVNVERFPSRAYRRALARAIDRSKLPGLLKGGQVPTASLTPGRPLADLDPADRARCADEGADLGLVVARGELCYRPPAGLAYDVAAARAELAQARAELGPRFPAGLTIRYNGGVDANRIVAEWIQEEWRKNLGLKVDVEPQEWRSFLAATRAHDYDVARFAYGGNLADPETEFLPPYRCGAPENRTGFCNAEVEALLAAAEAEIDRGRRLERVRDAERIILEEAPVIPLWINTHHLLVRPYVHGLAVNSVDQQSLRDVWIEGAR